MTSNRIWLGGLPPAVARQIAWKNGAKLFGLSGRRHFGADSHGENRVVLCVGEPQLLRFTSNIPAATSAKPITSGKVMASPSQKLPMSKANTGVKNTKPDILVAG